MEYRKSSFVEDTRDNRGYEALNGEMRNWVADGWELVSTNAQVMPFDARYHIHFFCWRAG